MRTLKCFANSDVRGFTELARSLSMDTDLCGYYLRKLQARELVKNIDRGTYEITPLGKSVLAHQKQLTGLDVLPRISVLLIARAQDTYLMTQRLKQPLLNKL